MKCALIGMTVALVLAGCGTGSSSLMTPQDSYGRKMCKKLGRGIVNGVSAPLEPLNQALNYAAKADHAMEGAAAFTGGLFAGALWWMPARFVTGALDIATFPLPPFFPLLKPEFIQSEVELSVARQYRTDRPTPPAPDPPKK